MGSTTASRRALSLCATAIFTATTLTLGVPTEPFARAEVTPDVTDAAGPAERAAVGISVNDERIRAARETPEEWLSYGFGYEEQRHSPLDKINKETVKRLGVAWSYDLATHRGVEATPIVVDGVMFITSAWSIVYALDAKTGEELWVHDPEVDKAVGVKACCDVVNRGVAVYEGKVFLGVIDGRVQALDASTGEVIWSKVTVDQSKPYTITGAPRVVKGKVLIGNGGAELGVRGYLSAYDADTGDLAWRFYTTPNPEKQPDGAVSDPIWANFANETWGDDGEWKADGGGGTVWDSIIYDEVHDRVIFGVGNGSPWAWKRRDPSGKDNLFLSSIVAVDAETGEYAWHFQTTPGDTWDYTATQTLILANLPVGEDGAEKRVVMQAPKNGFFYVIDAETGDFISGEAFVPLNWATGLDEAGRPIVLPEARDQSTAFLQNPGPLGAHNWHPMAYNPDLQLAYIPAQEIPQIYRDDPKAPYKAAKWNTGINFAEGIPVEVPRELMKALRSMLKGRLIAWDPVKQEARWSVEHPNAWNGGILSTGGGLVFQGTLGGEFAAYDSASGEKLWSGDLKSGGASGPGTFEIDGEQYVTITTGWGSAYALVAGYGFDEKVPPAVGKVVTFKLDGDGTIPDNDLEPIAQIPAAPEFGDDSLLAEGNVHFHRNCMVCHGAVAISSGVLPDLRWAASTGDPDIWRDIVIEGALASNGMVSFADVITEEESEAIRAYVLSQAHSAALVD
ncbi:MAG: PQQ-dependent dehydrogenase, methanol/ethanol family [Pseudomonadota bacterium]